MTTLETLAPYLPYNLPVEYTGHASHVFQCLLIGLNKSHARLKHLDTSITRVDYSSVAIEDVRPHLRSFADLCTPLANGMVPAKVLAAMMINPISGQSISRYELHKQTDGVVVYAYEPVPFQDDRVYAKAFITEADGLLVHGKRGECWDVDNLFNAIDYLRRNHFAVGLTADQYIRKGA